MARGYSIARQCGCYAQPSEFDMSPHATLCTVMENEIMAAQLVQQSSPPQESLEVTEPGASASASAAAKGRTRVRTKMEAYLQRDDV